jgi:dolichyl-phosphate-mannose--protein O-mannosyl transferase
MSFKIVRRVKLSEIFTTQRYQQLRTLIEKRFWLFLIAILIFAFVTRWYRLAEPKRYIFDEVYHAITAKLIRRNDVRAFEWWNPPVEPDTAVDWLHPPLAKYTQALSMEIFGENSFGWRFSSVVFGTGVILLTALLAKELFGDKVIAILAAFLASTDGLLLTQSRIAMNDIHVTFFILLTLLCYVKFRNTLKEQLPKAVTAARQLVHRQQRWLIFSGLSAGLALGSKWSGLFVVLTLWFFEVWRTVAAYYSDRELKWKEVLRQLATFVLVLVILTFFVYLLSYTDMFLQGKSLVCQSNTPIQGECYCSQESSTWVKVLSIIVPSQKATFESWEARGGCKRLISHFSELNHQIVWYQKNLKATHPYQSRPLQWFLDARPVWFHVEYGEGTITNIYAQGNPVLFWLGDIAVLGSVVWLGYTLFKTKKIFSGETFTIFFLLFAYFAVWLPWIISPRIMFFYHYTPAVPLMSILLAFWVGRAQANKQLGSWRAIAPWLIALISFATFVLFYPNWTGIPVPTKFAENFYFVFKSWR